MRSAMPIMNNSAFEKSTAVRSRNDTLELALAVVDRFDDQCRRRGLAMIRAGAGTLSAFDALRHVVASQIADRLEPNRPARGARFNLVSFLYPLKARGDGWVRWLSDRKRTESFRARSSDADVLFIARHENLVRDQLPVAHALKARGVQSRFLTFRSNLLASIEREGFNAIDARSLAVSNPLRASVCLAQAVRVAAQLSDAAPAFLSSAEWRAALVTAVRVLAQHLESAQLAADAITTQWKGVPPSAVVVGNPTTLEGRLALAAGRAAGTSTACIQHGLVVPKDAMWRRVPIDLICAWGPTSVVALRQSGFDEKQLIHTGAPWTDTLKLQPRTATVGARTFLIALSGAGHLVGAAEHSAAVDAIFDAAARLPDDRFLFRLHFKDPAAPYRELKARRGATNVEIDEPSASRSNLFEQLARAAALITLTSTAAIDAMLAGVPVITLGRSPGQWVADFTAATTQVSATGLPQALTSVAENGAKARAYVEQYFGPRDGGAAGRVASALLGLGAGKATKETS